MVVLDTGLEGAAILAIGNAVAIGIQDGGAVGAALGVDGHRLGGGGQAVFLSHYLGHCHLPGQGHRPQPQTKALEKRAAAQFRSAHVPLLWFHRFITLSS